MAKKDFKVKNVLYAEPFRQIIPEFGIPSRETDGFLFNSDIYVNPRWRIVPQSDFLRQLYPSGHNILDPKYYPDEISQTEVDIENEDGTVTRKKMWVRREVSRVALPLQYVIKTQQNIHLCGNDIFFKDSNSNPSEEEKKLLNDVKQLWEDRNMQACFYANVDSEKCTGNTATAFYFKEADDTKKIYWKTYSYLDGYRLFEHRNPFTNDMTQFAVQYSQFDEDGKRVIDYVDVWDSTYFYHFRQDLEGVRGVWNSILEAFGLDNYSLENFTPHGFPFCPVAAKRNRLGACWTPVQSLIDMYEKALSQFCENSKVLGTAMVFIKGGNINVEGMADGRPYVITSTDANADAKIMNKNDASSAYDTQLKILRDNIFLGAFCVSPPEVKSGDLPGIAIKLIYSPSLEKAMDDVAEWDIFVDELLKIFKYGAGVEMKKSSRVNSLRMSGKIMPYVHENTAELINSLCQSKLAGITSTETASGRAPYNATNEYILIKREQKEAEKEEAETQATQVESVPLEENNPHNNSLRKE